MDGDQAGCSECERGGVVLQGCTEPRTPEHQCQRLTLTCAQVMTQIGGLCLGTILVWSIVELSVQFGHYNHACRGGEGAHPCR